MKKAVLLLSIIAAGPVCADTTAVYHAPGRAFEMRVEVSANGNVRGAVTGQKAYFLTVDGLGYLVLDTPTGPAVERLDDVSMVLRETLEQMLAQHPDLNEAMAKEPNVTVKESGTATINGRVGKAYFFEQPDGSLSPHAVAVVTDDPTLAELGRAMEHQLEMSLRMNPTAGQGSFATQMIKILKDGTALTFGGGDLDLVTHGTIDPARFSIPAKPETIEQVRARFKANGGHLP